MKEKDNLVELDTTDLENVFNIDRELKFSRHVEIQTNKANKILDLIGRSYESIHSESLKTLFTALVRPHLEYSVAAWPPRLTKDKKLIEGVLKRTSKLKSLGYEERLKSFNLPIVCYRRSRRDMIEAYKYTHGL